MEKLTRTDVEQLIASGSELNFQSADLSNLDEVIYINEEELLE